MPKVKAYAGKGRLIPVDAAAVVDAYECPWTGKMFRHKDTYARHLNSIREYQIHPVIRERNANKIKQELWNQDSFEGIVKWLQEKSLFLFEQSARMHWMNQDEVPHARKNFKFEITYLKLEYKDCVSNSHSCPQNGIQNWRGDELFADGSPKPRGYPGWWGRIEYLRSHDIGFASDLLRPFHIHTGTGGGAGITRPAGYEVKIFKADFPGLAAKVDEEYEKYQSNAVMERLKDNYITPFHFDFVYGEPNYFRR